MDHIRRPSQTGAEAFEVPYTNVSYDSSIPFKDYPERKGFSIGKGRLNIGAGNGDAWVSFIQEWLYFGLLANFFGDIVIAEQFICISETTGERIIDSKALPRYIDGWGSSMGVRSNSEEMAILANLDDLISYSSLMSEYAHSSSSLHPALPIIVASIKILIDTLGVAVSSRRFQSPFDDESVLTRLLRGKTPFLKQPSPNTHHAFQPSAASLFRNYLLQHGWCPYVLAKLLTSSTHAYYLTSLPRKESRDFNHQNCSRTACTRNTIDTSSYKSKHVVDGCSCQPVEASVDDMISIIDDGGMPLVSYTRDQSNNGKIELIKSDPHMRYIAISHVWSDGLGCQDQINALPQCQLDLLDERLKNFRSSQSMEDPSWWFTGKPVYFIDSLSLPVGPENQRYRNLGIARLARTFAKAHCVFVLDWELQQIPHRILPPEQRFAHISCAAWSGRCWTLCEAVLAREIFVQFKDGVFNMIEAWDEEFLRQHKGIRRRFSISPRKQMIRGSLYDIFCQVSRFYWSMPTLPPTWSRRTILSVLWEDDAKTDRFLRAWNGLLERSTSREEDMITNLAILIGLSAGEILNLRKENRIGALLRAQKFLPLSLLCNGGVKMTETRLNRWAPQSLSGRRLSSLAGNLEVSKTALILHASPKAELRLFLIPLSEARVLRFCLVDDVDLRKYYCQLDCPEVDDFYDENNIRVCLVIFNEPSVEARSQSQDTGFRLAIEEYDQRTVRGIYDCEIRVLATSASEDGAALQNTEDEWPIIRGQRMPNTSQVTISTDMSIFYKLHYKRPVEWALKSTITNILSNFMGRASLILAFGFTLTIFFAYDNMPLLYALNGITFLIAVLDICRGLFYQWWMNAFQTHWEASFGAPEIPRLRPRWSGLFRRVDGDQDETRYSDLEEE